jgi:hypothetical protein
MPSPTSTPSSVPRVIVTRAKEPTNQIARQSERFGGVTFFQTCNPGALQCPCHSSSLLPLRDHSHNRRKEEGQHTLDSLAEEVRKGRLQQDQLQWRQEHTEVGQLFYKGNSKYRALRQSRKRQRETLQLNHFQMSTNRS